MRSHAPTFWTPLSTPPNTPPHHRPPCTARYNIFWNSFEVVPGSDAPIDCPAGSTAIPLVATRGAI